MGRSSDASGTLSAGRSVPRERQRLHGALNVCQPTYTHVSITAVGETMAGGTGRVSSTHGAASRHNTSANGGRRRGVSAASSAV